MRFDEKPLLDRELIDGIIKRAQICHLACSLDDQPYVLPISFGYDGINIYLHTSPGGKKIKIFTKNPLVCLSFERNITLQPNSELACKWSFSFQSVILDGTISEMTKPEEKNYGLAQIMAHYSNSDWQFPPEKVNKTRIWKVIPNNITAKTSR